jgi:photosystem II stability/assembly factor-like uncharacterized protein
MQNCLFKLKLLVYFLLFFSAANAQVKPSLASERIAGLQKRKLLEQTSPFKDSMFRNIGPTIMSGRVTDLEVNPLDPTEFYVAYASGGLWHTTNNGQSFIPLFDHEDVMTIGDIAVNWQGNRIIWIGTGEVNSSRSSYAGNGIYKSDNGGKNWSYLGLPESHHIGKIILHPTEPNTIWVAALGHLYSSNPERGVYKTTDGGKSWQHSLKIDDNTGAVDLDIDPRNPNHLYAAVWYRTRRAWNFEESGATSGVYETNDGGKNWVKISLPENGFASGTKLGRIGVSISLSNPNIVYAVIDQNQTVPDTGKVKQEKGLLAEQFKSMSAESFLSIEDSILNQFLRKNYFPKKYNAESVKQLVREKKIVPSALSLYLDAGDDGFGPSAIKGCEVYRSDDGGKNWKKTNQKPILIYNTYGYYFGKIYVSPVNPDKLVILGFYALMSTDGGKSFSKIDGDNVHPDHHALWMNPLKDSHMINGNDGGVNITYDDGKNWFKANSPAVGQFYAIAVDNAKPYYVYGGLQDNGSWFGPSNYTESAEWHESGKYAFSAMNGGDGMQVQVDTRENKIVYTGYQFGNYSRIEKTNPIVDRLDIRPFHELGEPPLRFNWQTPILLSSHNQDVFYIGSNRLHRSFNKGENLQAISGDLTGGGKKGNVPFGTLTSITESPLRFGLLYTGSDDGYIHITRDGGATWKALHPSLPKQVQGLYVSRLVASKFVEGRVYLTLNGYRSDHFDAYVFVSEDYGQTWKRIAADLPSEPVNVIREDPKNQNILYIGTDNGLYVSLNRGNQTFAWRSGLPRVAVHDIAIQDRKNEIVVGTHGRSLYIASLNQVQEMAKADE